MLLSLLLLIEVDGVELTVSELEGRLDVNLVAGDVVEYVPVDESEVERLVVGKNVLVDEEVDDDDEVEVENEDVSIVDEEVFDGKVVHLMVVLMVTVCQRQSKRSWRYD